MHQFSDHFSPLADSYSQYRPHYPTALFAWLGEQSLTNDHAWDCATGNGQAAIALANHFERITATDGSNDQVHSAVPHPRVSYHTATAENSGLPDQSVSLITVAQAMHWFNLDSFYEEARRVLKPKGLLAAWCYNLHSMGPELDPIIRHFYDDIVGPYWPPERLLVEQHYTTIPFPFDEVQTPDFEMITDWTVDQLLGYISTWSSCRYYRDAKNEDPLTHIEQDVRDAWGSTETRRGVWPLTVKVGRV